MNALISPHMCGLQGIFIQTSILMTVLFESVNSQCPETDTGAAGTVKQLGRNAGEQLGIALLQQ